MLRFHYPMDASDAHVALHAIANPVEHARDSSRQVDRVDPDPEYVGADT
jgi:hypothetical protein